MKIACANYSIVLILKRFRGCASHPNVLIEAGIQQADMLIAVTDSDEINMMGCQIAYSLSAPPIKSHAFAPSIIINTLNYSPMSMFR